MPSMATSFDTVSGKAPAYLSAMAPPIEWATMRTGARCCWWISWARS